MKKYIFLFIAAILTVSSTAKTIHWITFIDTTDKRVDAQGVDHGVGEMDKNGRKVLYSRFIDVVNAALAEKGYVADKQDYWDTSTSPENCKKAVQNLSVEPDDIIMFYYIGHGGRPEGQDPDKFPYPQMFLAQHSDNRLVPLTWVHDVLKSKGARLTVTIGMCCNSETRGMTPKTMPTFNVNYGNAYVDGGEVTAIQKLFLENKGDLLATSASPRETSAGNYLNGFGAIDFYTAALVVLFEESSKSGSLQWKPFFNNLAGLVSQINPDQHPIYTPNITSASEPSQQQRERPREEDVKKGPQTQQDQRTDDGNNALEECFDYIIDKNVPLSKRVEMSNRLKAIFTSGAPIKILGQDVDRVIDKESAEVFFQRISTSRLLLKVVPVDGKFTSDNRLSEMRVREYYRK